jgi:predicted RNA-binding protein
MWPFKKKEVDKKVVDKKVVRAKVKKDKIMASIKLKDGSIVYYTKTYEYNSGKSCIGAFLDFYRWLYEKESPMYSIKTIEGVVILLRSEIKLVEMTKSVIGEEVNE